MNMKLNTPQKIFFAILGAIVGFNFPEIVDFIVGLFS